MSKLSRRTFLRCSSATVVLPLLDANVSALPKVARGNAIPKRVAFVAMGYGVDDTQWFPSTKQKGSDYDMPASLKPFESVKSDISIVQNLTNKFSLGAHSATANFLTCANVRGGGKFTNTVSCDQLAAQALGSDTRHSSIAIGGGIRSNDGHGGGFGYASWDKDGKPVGVYRNLTSLYRALFGSKNASTTEIRAKLKRKQSSLDALTDHAKRLDKKISTEDRDRVDEYFSTIRSIENRLSKAMQWIDTPHPEATFDLPKGKIDGREELQLNFDMMHLAFQSDSTRVMTYMLPTQSIIKLVADFVKKLKATKEHDGSSVLDHSMIAYGTSLRKVHNMKNGPMLLAGHGGGGIKQGQNYIFTRNKTPIANLWLSMIRHVGVNQDKFSNSTGVLKEMGFR